MKNKEQAAKEYAVSKMVIESGYILTARNAFLAGVEYTQRWISVEEELPEYGKKVLVKSNTGDVGMAWLSDDTDRKRWYVTANSSVPLSSTTHWRPVEIE